MHRFIATMKYQIGVLMISISRNKYLLQRILDMQVNSLFFKILKTRILSIQQKKVNIHNFKKMAFQDEAGGHLLLDSCTMP